MLTGKIEKENRSGDRAIRSFRRGLVIVLVVTAVLLGGALFLTISNVEAPPVVTGGEEPAVDLSEQQKCREAQYDPNSDVIQLTEDNFYELTSTPGTSWLVEFYSPYCSHCQAMKPQWEKTATILKNEDFPWRVGKVDGTCERKLMKDFSVTGFPTIYFFEGDEQKRYESGVRMAVVFIEWAKEQSWLFAQRFGRYEN